MLSYVWPVIGPILGIGAVIFSVFVATFSGEWADEYRNMVLNGLEGTKLGKAQFGCASRGADAAGCTSLQRAVLDWAQLQGANLDQARLQGASLGGVQLQGA